MRLLKFNNELVDIDDKTAIGIDYQAYDISEPGSRKVPASNKFTIPRTANNMRLIGFAGNPQSISQIVYFPIACQYFNYNKCLIRNGTARVTEVADRISVFIYEKSTVWTELQDYTWSEFQSDFIDWMISEKGLPSATSPFVGTFTNFLTPYISSNEGVILPFLISNLSLYDPAEETDYIETLGKLYLKYTNGSINGMGGHFCVFCKTIFEFIEDHFNIDLSVLDTSYDYNIFEDAIASVMFTPLRNLTIEHTSNGFYFRYNNEGQFLPEETTEDKADKTLYDFTKAFFQYFNCLIDQVPTLDNTEKYIIRRFDNIINAPVVDLSGKLSGVQSFQPVIEGYNQNNWIKFSAIYEGGDELVNSKKIICRNQNLDIGSPSESLFDIDIYIPSGFVAGGDIILNLSLADTFNTFSFFITEAQASTTVASTQEGAEVSASMILKIAKLYSLASEYNTIASMVEYPSFYKIKRWLTLTEVEGLVYFARYYMKELNGYFFLNKIEGYNPEKSNEPTSIELIKIPA